MDLSSCPVTSGHWERTMKANGTTVLHISIHRPVFPSAGKVRRIEHYFSQLAKRWQTRWETELYRGAAQALAERPEGQLFLPWNAAMDFRITFWDPPLISLRIDIQELRSTAPPAALWIGEVWDCSSGYPCSLRAFLPPRPHRWKQALIAQLQDQAQQRLNSGESLLYAGCLQRIRRSFDPNRYYLTEDGITVFYPQCMLGSRGEGIPTFTIPIAEQIQSNKFLALSNTAQR